MFNFRSMFLFLFFSFFQTYRSQLNVFSWCEWGISHLVWLPYYRKLTCISKICVFPRRVNFYKRYFRRHWLSGMFFRDLKFPSIWLNFRYTCKVLDMPKKAKSFILVDICQYQWNCEEPSKWRRRYLSLTTFGTFRENTMNKVSISHDTFFFNCFWCLSKTCTFLKVAFISFILKCHPLFRVNFFYSRRKFLPIKFALIQVALNFQYFIRHSSLDPIGSELLCWIIQGQHCTSTIIIL